MSTEDIVKDTTDSGQDVENVQAQIETLIGRVGKEIQPFTLPPGFYQLNREILLLENLGEALHLPEALRLKEIRDRKLYTQAGYKTFQSYINKTLSLSRSAIYHHIRVLDNFEIDEIKQLPKYEVSKFVPFLSILGDDSYEESEKQKIREAVYEKIRNGSSVSEMKSYAKKLKNDDTESDKIPFDSNRIVLRNNSIQCDNEILITFGLNMNMEDKRHLLKYYKKNYSERSLYDLEKKSSSEESNGSIYDKLKEALSLGDIDTANYYLDQIKTIPLTRDNTATAMEKKSFYVTKAEVKKYKRRPYSYNYRAEYDRKKKLYKVIPRPKVKDRFFLTNIEIVVDSFFSRDIILIQKLFEKIELTSSVAIKIALKILTRLNQKKLDPFIYKDILEYFINHEKFLQSGFVDVTGKNNLCALQWAIKNKNKKLAKLLVKLNFPVDIIYEESFTNRYNKKIVLYKTSALERTKYFSKELTVMILKRYLTDDIYLDKRTIEVILDFNRDERMKKVVLLFLKKYVLDKMNYFPAIEDDSPVRSNGILNISPADFKKALFVHSTSDLVERIDQMIQSKDNYTQEFWGEDIVKLIEIKELIDSG